VDAIPAYTATVEDVARAYNISVRTVWRWLKTKDIPHRRIGGVLRFNLQEVDAWMEAGGNTASVSNGPEEGA
jgi:excisionase family DNA binding protein